MGRSHTLAHTGDPTSMSRSPLVRAANVFVGGLALALSAPLLAVFGLWVRQSSNGPVFQRQPAFTPDGERCLLLSFRVLIDGAATATHERMRQLFGTGDERTVTAPGRVIRALRLERLPRLINVVKGESSLF